MELLGNFVVSGDGAVIEPLRNEDAFLRFVFAFLFAFFRSLFNRQCVEQRTVKVRFFDSRFDTWWLADGGGNR